MICARGCVCYDVHVGSGDQNLETCMASTSTCWVISLPGNTFYLKRFLRNKEVLSDQRFLEKIYCLCVCMCLCVPYVGRCPGNGSYR